MAAADQPVPEAAAVAAADNNVLFVNAARLVENYWDNKTSDYLDAGPYPVHNETCCQSIVYEVVTLP